MTAVDETATNRAKVEEALRVFAEGLGPWLGGRLGGWPPNSQGLAAPHDPSYLIAVLLDQRNVFADVLPAFLGDLYRVREIRNRWAHLEALDDTTTRDAVEAVESVLGAIGSPLAGALTTAPARTAAVPAPLVQRTGHRRSRSLEFRAQQWEHRYAPHCRPVNTLVDDLIRDSDGRWMPYVAPYHGGTEAKIVLLFQDPGRMTFQAHGGSGFIGCENDDPTAELLAECLDLADVDQSAVLPWNAYPWFLPDQGNITVARRKEGLDPLQRLLALLPDAHTVVTCGAVAHDSWARFEHHYPEASTHRHLETFHTSGRGITNGGRQPKADGVAHVVATLRRAAVPPAA